MKLTLALSLVVCFTCSLHAGDWLEFRGNSGQGLSDAEGLPVAWGKDSNVVWKAPIEGLGWSSPIIVNGKIYLTTAISEDGFKSPNQTLRTICLDEKTGKPIWDLLTFEQKSVNARVDRIHGKNSQASPTPISDGKHLFVHFGVRGTACLTLDGDVVWKNQELDYVPVHGNGGSPALVDDLLIISCDGSSKEFICAMEKKTGHIRWTTDRTAAHLRKKFAFTTPLAIEVGGKKQIVSQGAGAVYGYNPTDGSVLWQVDYGDGYSVIPRPVFAHGLVFISSGYDRPTLYAIDPTGKGNVTDTHVKWTMKKGAPHTPSPLVVGDLLFLVSDGGIATCLDAKTGEQHWQERLGGKYSASPLSAEGRVYIQSEEGEGIVINASKEYKELARNTLEGRTFASYAVSGKSLFIRTEKQLYRIGG
jgi:outer membrane protein assembly factor BamB